jgi:hypothetical protein
MFMRGTFGVIIGCSSRDYRFAKATVAATRHFLSDVSICLLVDGEFSTRRICRKFNCTALKRSEIKNDWLRLNSFGWGITKMVAFFESPFDRFLWLDCDTIPWGDIRSKLNLSGNWDVFIDRPDKKPTSAEYVSTWFFDTSEIEKLHPEFPWQAFASMYFCTGVFAARRGCFALDDYQELLNFSRQCPTVFKFGEMGFLNYMIAREKLVDSARVSDGEIQTLICDYDYETLSSRFGLALTLNTVICSPTVFHYTGGTKPEIRQLKTRPELSPAITFRVRALPRLLQQPKRFSLFLLELEDRWARRPSGLRGYLRMALMPSIRPMQSIKRKIFGRKLETR